MPGGFLPPPHPQEIGLTNHFGVNCNLYCKKRRLRHHILENQSTEVFTFSVIENFVNSQIVHWNKKSILNTSEIGNCLIVHFVFIPWQTASKTVPTARHQPAGSFFKVLSISEWGFKIGKTWERSFLTKYIVEQIVKISSGLRVSKKQDRTTMFHTQGLKE